VGVEFFYKAKDGQMLVFLVSKVETFGL